MAFGASGIGHVRIGPENDIARAPRFSGEPRAERSWKHIASLASGRLLDQGPKAHAPSIIDNHLPRGLLAYYKTIPAAVLSREPSISLITTMTADTPYNFEDADIVLRTPLSKGFRVHRAVLSAASPLFETLTAEVPEPDELDRDALPEVDVTEGPEDLDILLRLIYPTLMPPKFEDFDTLGKAITVLKAHKIDGVQELLKPILISQRFLAADPIRVYAMACRFGYKEEYLAAAPLAAAKDFTNNIRGEDLRNMAAVDYHRLVALSKERLKKIKGDIFAAPIPCSNCPSGFYDQFRQKLGDRLLKEQGGKFYDTMECLEMFFTVSKECGTSSNCTGSGGEIHFEKFVLDLVKEVQKPPTRIYE